MAFGDNLLECLGLKNELSGCSFRITVFGEEGVVIGGVKKIAKISDEEISFLTSKKTVSVIGKNLKITSYGEKESAISGIITGVKIG